MNSSYVPKVAQVYTKFLNEPWAVDLFRSLPKEAKFAAGLSLGDQPIDPDQHLLRHGLEELRSKSLLGSRVHQLQYRGAKFLKGDEVSRLYDPFEKEGIELVHAHFADTAYTFLPLVRKLKLPLVFSFYGWDYAKLPSDNPEYLEYFMELFDYASAVVAEGPFGAGTIEQLGCPPEKIKVVPLGLPSSAFPQSYGTLVAKTEQIVTKDSIVQAAAFTEKKGQHITLQAFEQVAAEFPAATLTFIAPRRDGSYEKQVRNLCLTSPYHERIVVLPAVPYDELSAMLSQHAIFCQPSIHAQDGDSEGGAPVTILMAQAQGLATIGSTHCDIPFVTAPLGWNKLAEEGSVDQLAVALRAGLKRSEHSFASDVSKLKAWTKENFSIEKSSSLLQQLYREIHMPK